MRTVLWLTGMITLTLAMLFSPTGPSAAAAAASYTVVDLGILGSCDSVTLAVYCSEAWSVNNLGQVVGDSFPATGKNGSIHAFRWSPVTFPPMIDLGTLANSGLVGPPDTSYAYGVNDSSLIVGVSSTADSLSAHAFLDDNTGMHDLGTLGGAASEARAINNSGQVVGSATTLAGSDHAFLWTAANGMSDLGTLPNDSGSLARGINNAGQVVGWSYPFPSSHRAFLYSNGAMKPLGTLPGGAKSEAWSINNLGQVVGWSDSVYGTRRAFLYDSNGMQDLGTLPGLLPTEVASQADAINDQGQVVGWSRSTVGFNVTPNAILWTASTGMVDLNTLIPSNLGWHLLEARSINNSGQIAGVGDINGQSHAFLLLPLISSTPAVSLSATNLDFGSQIIGAVSATQTVTLTNSGTAPLTISNVSQGGTNPGDFDGLTHCKGATIAPGQSCTTDMTFTPTTMGSRGATLIFTDNAVDSPQVVTLSGTGGGTPAVSLSAPSLSFGSQAIGTISATQTVTLTNSGTAPLTISSLLLSGPNFSSFPTQTNCNHVTLVPGKSCTNDVRFSPIALGSLSATLTFTDNVTGSPQVVTFSGVGAGTPTASLSATSLIFGSQPLSTTSATQMLTVTNSGTAPLTITGVIRGGANPLDFNDQSNCIGAVLAPGRACTNAVTFAPTRTGSRGATLIFTDNAADSPQAVTLSGTGVAPALAQSVTSGGAFSTVTITGSNFAAGEGVALYWDSSATTLLTSTTSAPDGSFVATLTVPQAVAGTHSIIAVGQTSALSASAAFRVTPAVYLFPTSGKAGSVSYMVGVGFGANETVAALWYPGVSLLNHATSNAVGTVVVPVTVPAVAPGPFYVIGYGVSSKVYAFAQLTVTALSLRQEAVRDGIGAQPGLHGQRTVTIMWECATAMCRSTDVGDLKRASTQEYSRLRVTIPFPATTGETATTLRGLTQQRLRTATAAVRPS